MFNELLDWVDRDPLRVALYLLASSVAVVSVAGLILALARL